MTRLKLSTIKRLFSSCCPTAIFLAITLFVVNSVQSEMRTRAFTHIGEEVGKFQPRLANSYPSSPVIAVILMGRIQAPAFHVSPGRIRARYLVFPGKIVPMFPVKPSHLFPPEAPTTSRVWSGKIGAESNNSCSAITHAIPSSLVGLAQHSKTPESESSQVFRLRHIQNNAIKSRRAQWQI